MTTTTLEELTRVVAAMPADAAKQVLDFAVFLQHRASGPVDYSELTDEDKRAIANETLRRFDAEHPDENWGEDLSRPGGTNVRAG